MAAPIPMSVREAVIRDIRAGKLSTGSIALNYGISRASVQDFMKRSAAGKLAPSSSHVPGGGSGPEELCGARRLVMLQKGHDKFAQALKASKAGGEFADATAAQKREGVVRPSPPPSLHGMQSSAGWLVR